MMSDIHSQNLYKLLIIVLSCYSDMLAFPVRCSAATYSCCLFMGVSSFSLVFSSGKTPDLSSRALIG